jgi:hypothetical protein
MKPTNNIAVAYVRVSTKRQDRERYSPESLVLQASLTSSTMRWGELFSAQARRKQYE